MANITSKPNINVNRGKPSHIALEAPTGYNFATTRVDAVKDSRDPELFFDVVNWKPNSTKKILKIKIRGRGYPSTLAAKTTKAKSKTAKGKKILVDPPDSGNLVITISDPLVPTPPPVEKLPVIYVDDPTP